MLAKDMLRMVSAVNSKDIRELRYLFSPMGMTSTGHDIATLVSSYGTEQLKAMLSPNEFQLLEAEGEIAERVFGQFEQVVDTLRSVIEILRMRGRGVDRPVYRKALFKLNELQTALRCVDDR